MSDQYDSTDSKKVYKDWYGDWYKDYLQRAARSTAPTAGKIKISVQDSEKDRKNNESISHPRHYQSAAGLEVIEVIEAFTSDLKGIEAVDTANAIKYICRWKKKGGIDDLEKCIWYIKHLIAFVLREERESDCD